MKRPNKMAATHHLIIIHKMESTIPTNPLSAKNVVEPFPTVLIFHLEPPCHHLVHHCQILEKRTALRHLAKLILSNVPRGVGYVCHVRSFDKIRPINWVIEYFRSLLLPLSWSIWLLTVSPSVLELSLTSWKKSLARARPWPQVLSVYFTLFRCYQARLQVLSPTGNLSMMYANDSEKCTF